MDESGSVFIHNKPSVSSFRDACIYIYIYLLEIGEQRFEADRSETEFPVICNVVNVVRSRVAGNYNGTPRAV